MKQTILRTKKYVEWWLDNVYDTENAYNDAIRDGYIDANTSLKDFKQLQLDNWKDYYEYFIEPLLTTKD